jgi:hypothetical protein
MLNSWETPPLTDVHVRACERAMFWVTLLWAMSRRALRRYPCHYCQRCVARSVGGGRGQAGAAFRLRGYQKTLTLCLMR